MKIGFYPGCSLNGTSREYNESVKALAQVMGLELIELKDWNCCGATAAHSMSRELSLALPTRVLALAEVAWSAPERKSWADFRTRAVAAVSGLKAKGYHPFDLEKEIGSRPESKQPVTHLASGKKVIYNSPYSPHYPAQGAAALTDGVCGDWTYGDGSWQGFIDAGGLDVTVDLGNGTAIRSVTATFMQVVGAMVYLPASVIISVSDDGVNFTELSRQTFPVDKEKAIRFKDISWKGDAKGRYVRYQARAGDELGGWVFTDEIIVR